MLHVRKSRKIKKGMVVCAINGWEERNLKLGPLRDIILCMY